MGYVQVLINSFDATRFVVGLDSLQEYNDESSFFSGVFRRGSLNLTLDNTSGIFDRENSVFPRRREGAKVDFFFIENNKDLDSVYFFSGLVEEGSTQNNITYKNLNLLVVDPIKNLEKEDVKQADIDAVSTRNLDANFIKAFLDVIIAKPRFSGIARGDVICTIESLFPPSDSFYDSEGSSFLTVFNDLLRGVNSYSVLNFTKGETPKLSVRAKNTTNTRKRIKSSDILSLENETDGFNKVYNSISINESKDFVDSSSVRNFGLRKLEIRSHAPPSEELAQTYFDYYSSPKTELDLVLKMNSGTLDLLIGEIVQVVLEKVDTKIPAYNLIGIIIARTLNFESEVLTLRLRQI